VSEAEKALVTAQNLADLRRWQDALEALGPALASEDTAYEAYCLRARILLATRPQLVTRLGQESWVGPAREAVRRALAFQPDGEWAHRLLANIFLVDGRTGAALREAEEAARLQPDGAVTLAMLSECQVKAYRQHDALRTAQAAVEANPQDPVAYKAMVKAARSLSRRAEAESACRAGLRLDPQNEDLLLSLAEILYEQQRVMEAGETYLAAARINPVGDAPVKALVQFWRHLRAAEHSWQHQAPDSEGWDEMCGDCPAPVDQACREFWRFTLEARDRVLQSVSQSLDIIEATVKSLGGKITEGAALRPAPRWSGGAWRREPYKDLDWSVLGLPEAPVRGDAERIKNGSRMLRHAGERAADFGQQFAPVATASTGLRVQGDEGADFHEIVTDLHAEVTALSAAYLACAAALSDFGDALQWAKRQTSDARGWADHAIRRRQLSTGELNLREAKAIVDKALSRSPLQHLEAIGPTLAAVIQEEARSEQDQELLPATKEQRQEEARREWEQERLAAVESAKTALITLRDAEARCAEAVIAAIPREPDPRQPEGTLRAG
jgi:tetratricopeptide (TPR) repeat protein